MDEEEKRAKRDLYKLWRQYRNGKLTYEKYLEEIDCEYFYPFLDASERKKLDQLHEEKEKQRQTWLKAESNKISHKQKEREKQKKIFRLICLIILIFFWIVAYLNR